jgi:hypothetical protein
MKFPMLAVLTLLGSSRSSTDCFPNPEAAWKVVSGTFELDQNLPSGTEVTYESRRNRKKWQVNFCGKIQNSSFLFSLPTSMDALALNMVRTGNSVKLSASKGKEIVGSGFLLLEEPSASLCLTILNGRGFFGLFQEAEHPIMVLDGLNLPRDLCFSYVGHHPSQVTKLCMGDFVGDEHRAVLSQTNWDSSVRDFL